MLPVKEWQLVQEFAFAFAATGGKMLRSDRVWASASGAGA
jgi:hypothetical protein